MKGIALHSIVPVRAEAREAAEQETQMLFGELCEIVEEIPRVDEQCTTGRWYRVKLENDGEEGWVDAKMVSPIGGKDYAAYRKAYQTSTATIVMPMAYAMSENNGQTIPLTAGTRLVQYQVAKDNVQGTSFGRFEVLGVGFRIDPSMVIEKPLELNEQNLLQVVRFFLNVPYLWGGKNALGMDCSGFVQVVMSLFGKRLPRNASEQAVHGRAVRAMEQVRAGDLVFFDKPLPASQEGNETTPHITHVGIVIDGERVVHCSGRVKVEKIDETGIYSIEQGGYSHHLVSIRRI